jgi:hypothetical protein
MAGDHVPRLSEAGDSLERKWAGVILTDLPEYELLWQRHIVPLTFRAAPEPEKRSQFVRPGIRPLFRDLIDAHYATFHHLVHCHLCRPKPPRGFRGAGRSRPASRSATRREFNDHTAP